MHTKCQGLLVAPVFAASLGLCFPCLLLPRIQREPLESPDCCVIDEYLALGGCLLKAARIVDTLFPLPSPEGQMPQNSVSPAWEFDVCICCH